MPDRKEYRRAYDADLRVRGNGRRRARRRNRLTYFLVALILLVALLAAAMFFLLVNTNPLSEGAEGELPFNYDNRPAFDETADETPAPLVLVANSTPTPMAAQAPEALPADTALPQEDGGVENLEIARMEAHPMEEGAQSANRLIPAAQEGAYFLPVFDKALRTPDDEMMIAVTIDYCNNAEKMQQVIEIASRYNAKLTLFPTGEALMEEGMLEGFRVCVRRYGFELENHCYSRKRDYTLSNGELALQIWKSGIAMSYALGGDYEQHFFRPFHKSSFGDQRTHYFIGKLGMLGIGGYTQSYRDFDDAQSLVATLSNGSIYQFDMTDKSMSMLEEFVRLASAKGYRLVTMNKLFGLEENALSTKLTIDTQVLPSMDDYAPSYYPLKLNDHVYAVYLLQSRLTSLGYLAEDVKPDGIYGSSTSIAVSAFQAKVGLPATGNADVETLEQIYMPNAPRADENI